MLGLVSKLHETELHCIHKCPERVLLITLHSFFQEWVQKWKELVPHCFLRMLNEAARVLSDVVVVDEFGQDCINEGPQLTENREEGVNLVR